VWANACTAAAGTAGLLRYGTPQLLAGDRDGRSLSPGCSVAPVAERYRHQIASRSERGTIPFGPECVPRRDLLSNKPIRRLPEAAGERRSALLW